MKNKISFKLLSILLTVLTLMGCLSAGFTAVAAHDPWQTLAISLQMAKGQADDDAALWAVMEAYWAAAKKVRSWKNKDPHTIGEAVLRELIDRDCMTLEELMDCDAIALLRRFEGSDGVFELSRSRYEALLSLPGSVDAIPNKLVLSQRWDWNKFRRSDAEKLDVKALKRALKDWCSLDWSRDLTRLDMSALEKSLAKTETALAALQEQNISAELLTHFGLPAIAQANTLRQQIDAQKEIAGYLYLAEPFAKPKNPRWLTDKRLQEELSTARENSEALELLSREEPEIFAAVAAQENVNLQAAQEYLEFLTQAMTTSDANTLVAQIAGAIQGCTIDGTVYPAMTYSQQKYVFNSAGLSYNELLKLYETIVLADAALTGRIGSQANFAGYDVAARLRTAHGITVADASAKAIAAVRTSLKTVDARLAADYSSVPTGSNWQNAASSGYVFELAPDALQALNDAGGPLKADAGKPSYERVSTGTAPLPVKINPALTGAADTAANYITTPDWSISNSAPAPAVPPVPAPVLTSGMIAEEAGFITGMVNGVEYSVYADYLAAWANYIYGAANYATGMPPAAPASIAAMQTYLGQAQTNYNAAFANYLAKRTDYAKWEYTKAAYAWIAHYESVDYPAVPNTAQPPADNSSRDNTEYPMSDGYAEKYAYLTALQARFRLDLIYVMAKDTALQVPENAYRWLQCRWHDYEVDPSDENHYAYVTAINTYFAMLQRNADGTYTEQNGAFVPKGVNELITETRAAQQQIEIISGYGAFFHAYRLSLAAGDFVRYSNGDLSAELAATEAKLVQFEKYFPGEDLPPSWTGYRTTLRQAMKNRVFSGLESLNGSAEDIAKKYNASTLLPKPGSGYTYNFSNLELWESLEACFTLSSAEAALLALAQEVYAYLKGVLYSYETLHWELNAGQNAVFGSDWLPERGLKDPIVLKAGHDEFQVEYEHVETLIDKLDTLLTSTYFKDHLRWGSSPSAQQPPAFTLPELDAGFVIRLGEMRSSERELVIEDPNTGISITLPALPTQLDQTRISDETSRTTAQRSWIQAYRADVLLYLMHTVFEAINNDSAVGAADFLGWLLAQVLPDKTTSAGNEAMNKFTGTAVIEGVNNALADIDLSAAVRPFFTELLDSAVNQNLLSNKLPNTVLSLYAVVSEVLRPVFNEHLLINPNYPGGAGLIPDTRFVALNGLDLTLGYVLEEMTGKSRYQITVSDLAEHPALAKLFGDGDVTLPELFLGAELTPKDLIEKCWPVEWPKDTPTVPSGAPSYVASIAQELSDVYIFLNTPANFYAGQNDTITAWQGREIEFEWGLSNIEDPTLRRQAFEDVTAFSMSGIALLLSCVFGNTPLQVNIEGTPAAYLNSGEPGPQREDDRWYTDLRIGLASVTEGINNIIQGAVGAFNAVIDVLNAPINAINSLLPENMQLPTIPRVSIDELLLPDVAVSNYLGEASYTDDAEFPHWRGRFDSRVGMETKLSAVNAYGKVVIPLFELLNVTPLFSETEFIQAVAVPNAGALIQAADKTVLRETLQGISKTITQALTTPLLNWLAPLDDSLIPDSLGYKPVGKVLDLLPNLAFATERGMPAALLNDVLSGLTIDATLYLGGLSGEALHGIQQELTDYTTENYFEINYYIALFGTILPDLVNFGPLLDKILEAISFGTTLIFAQPIIKLADLPEGAYAGLLYNRNDGNGNEDDFLTVLEGKASATPGDGVREATLATLVGFFAGDSAASSLSFKLFGETGLPLGSRISEKLTANIGYCYEHETQHPKTVVGWLHHQTGIAIGGSLTELLNSVLAGLFSATEEAEAEAEPNQRAAQIAGIVKTATKNPAQLEGFLVELFNPQTYPATDFMRYALLDKAQSPDNNTFNPVQYNEKWNSRWKPKKADYLAENLNEFLDSLCQYLLGQDFAPWLQEQLNNYLGFDIRHPYNAQNLNAMLDIISNLLGGWDFGDDICAKADAIPDDDREAFTATLIEALQPLAPTLKICLTGGRTAADRAITKAGGNLTFLEDTLGFSGYDGYRHGLIPIYEHLGIPLEELPDYDEFLARATDPAEGDTAFFEMLISPLLNLYERFTADPLNELLSLMPNMIYFFAAEDEYGDNFSQCLNRLLRPVNAALDMVTPMLSASDAFALLGIPYPILFDAAGKEQEFRLPAQDSANGILIDFLQSFIGEFSDSVGLNITLALSDLTEFITGELKLYTSQSGQTDAVLLESAMPDLLTNLLRKLIVLIFTEENYAEFRQYIAERLPDNRRTLGLFFLDSCEKCFRRTLNKEDGVDRVLNMFYSKFFVDGYKLNIKLWFRELQSKISIWWYSLLSKSSISFIRDFANWRLDKLKENYFTLEEGWKPNGVIGVFQQYWAWFSQTLPGLSSWIRSVIQWMFPATAKILGI